MDSNETHPAPVDLGALEAAADEVLADTHDDFYPLASVLRYLNQADFAPLSDEVLAVMRAITARTTLVTLARGVRAMAEERHATERMYEARVDAIAAQRDAARADLAVAVKDHDGTRMNLRQALNWMDRGIRPPYGGQSAEAWYASAGIEQPEDDGCHTVQQQNAQLMAERDALRSALRDALSFWQEWAESDCNGRCREHAGEMVVIERLRRLATPAPGERGGG